MIYMKTTTIRVPEDTRNRLNALAKRRGSTAGEVVADLVRTADEDSLLAEAHDGWNTISADAQLLAAYRAESTDFDAVDAPLPPY